MTKNSATQPPSRQRYSNGKKGSSPSNSRNISGKFIAIFALFMAIVLVLVVVRYLQAQSRNTISGKTATVEVVDDHTFKLFFDVNRKNTDQDSYCIVKALNYDMAEVGRREVPIPRGGEKNERIEVDITTREPAVSADVYGCSEKIPFYLKIPPRES